MHPQMRTRVFWVPPAPQAAIKEQKPFALAMVAGAAGPSLAACRKG